MPLHIHSPRHIPFRQHTCVRHCRCACMWTTHVVCICIGQKPGHVLPPHVLVNGAMCTTLQVFPVVGIVMVLWCQSQVPPPTGGSCPRSRPGQSGTIPQQVQHPVRRSANPLPPSPHCHCPRHTAWAATGPTTQPGPHASPCAPRVPNVFSSVKSNKFCMGTHPTHSILRKVINFAWTHTQCLRFCQKQ